jgi:glycosyltransferase involved in cell wall biosynthesis
MRFAFFGAVFFQICRALKEHTDFDFTLFLDDNDPAVTTAFDLLGTSQPDWIVCDRFVSPASFLTPWRAPLTRHLRRYDVNLVSEVAPIFSQFADKPMYFFPIGFDLTVLPFPYRFRFRHPTVKDKAAACFLAAWQRRAIRRAVQVWAPPYSPYLGALGRLGVPESRRKQYYPLAVDEETFTERPGDAERAATKFPQLQSYDLVLLSPSRIMVTAHPSLVEAGGWKRNDVLLEGFANFVGANPGSRVCLTLIDRAVQPADRAAVLNRIRRLGIEEHVIWLQPPRPGGFTWKEMAELYLMADVVADDFGIGWFGGVALEALAMRRPVVTYIDEAITRELYPWHPMLSARTPDVVGRHLDALLRGGPEHRREVGDRGRAWIEEFHAPKPIAELYGRTLSAIETSS